MSETKIGKIEFKFNEFDTDLEMSWAVPVILKTPLMNKYQLGIRFGHQLYAPESTLSNLSYKYLFNSFPPKLKTINLGYDWKRFDFYWSIFTNSEYSKWRPPSGNSVNLWSERFNNHQLKRFLKANIYNTYVYELNAKKRLLEKGILKVNKNLDVSKALADLL